MSTELWDRKWSLVVDMLDVSEFRVKFKVEKSIKPEPNKALIEVYNLSKEHQAQLALLAPGKALAGKKGTTAPNLAGVIPVRLEAGYVGPGTDLICLQDLRTIDTELDAPDWVTAISSGDGERAYRTARINQSFGAKTSIDVAVKALVKALGVGDGNLAKVLSALTMQGKSTVLNRGLVLSGPVVRMLTDICKSADLEWSVQDGVFQVTDLNKALDGQAIKLSPETGLVGSPAVDMQGTMKCKALIIPGLRCGRVVVLDGTIVKGQFRIEKLKYEGDSHGNEWYVEIEGKRY